MAHKKSYPHKCRLLHLFNGKRVAKAVLGLLGCKMSGIVIADPATAGNKDYTQCKHALIDWFFSVWA